MPFEGKAPLPEEFGGSNGVSGWRGLTSPPSIFGYSVPERLVPLGCRNLLSFVRTLFGYAKLF